jgi:hypothetical protein
MERGRTNVAGSIVLALCGFCAATLLSAVRPPPASAWPCHETYEGEEHHCYAEARLEGYAGEQVASMGGAYIYLGCVGVPEQKTNINTDEMWAGIGPRSWMEAGIITGGTFEKEKYFDATTPRFFYSYYRNGTAGEHTAAVNEHIGSEAPTYTANWVEIKQRSPQKSKLWEAWTAGTGASIPVEFANTHGAERLTVGLETTSNEGWNDAAFTGLFMYSASGNEAKTFWGYEANNGHYFAPKVIVEESREKAFPQGYFSWESPAYEADFGYNNHDC